MPSGGVRRVSVLAKASVARCCARNNESAGVSGTQHSGVRQSVSVMMDSADRLRYESVMRNPLESAAVTEIFTTALAAALHCMLPGLARADSARPSEVRLDYATYNPSS